MICFDTDIVSAAMRVEAPMHLIRRLATVPKDEQCTTAVTLGTRFAKKPLELKIPITIAGMSFGALSGAAKEANTIIGQRLFSWTELLNRLETTLPDNVRISSLRPRVENDGTITVVMTVTGRSTEEIEVFMANLDATTVFTQVFASEDRRTDDGLVQATVEGKYAGTP